jgi:hypothetical protein
LKNLKIGSLSPLAPLGERVGVRGRNLIPYTNHIFDTGLNK